MKLSTIALVVAATAGGGVTAFEKRIVGGSAAPATAFPFSAFVVTSINKSALLCTAALVSPTILITSASCVADPVSNKALPAASVVVGQGDPTDAVAKVGSGNTAGLFKGNGTYASPKTVTVHPGYNSIANSDNIAVLILAQPIPGSNTTSSGFGAKIISKPETKANTLYSAIGWGSTSANSSSSYATALQQLPLKVGDKSACTNVWAPYANLTNSLCLSPVSKNTNVCNGDGLLVKTGSDNTVGLVGLLNIVATKDDFTSAQCTATGVFDFFTTFANYIGWLTQATPLKESDFLSTATFTYDTASNSSSPTSTASSTGSQTSASATQTSQTNANTSKPNSAPASKLMGSAPVAVIAGVLLAASGLF